MAPARVAFPLADAIRDYVVNRDSLQTIADRYAVSMGTVKNRLHEVGVVDSYRRRDQQGYKNHNFKDGLSRASVNRRTKEVLLAAGIDLTICQNCGDKFDHPLNRHHKDQNRANNELNNIENLCVKCHNSGWPNARHPRKRGQDGRLLPNGG